MESSIELFHLLLRSLDASCIDALVQPGFDLETPSRGGRANELDHGLKTYQRFPFPMQTDERKHAVFDFVPFTGAGRIMTNRDFQIALVAELPQEIFPSPAAGSVASAATGTNEQPPRGVSKR
jgi:hypothetical protein